MAGRPPNGGTSEAVVKGRDPDAVMKDLHAQVREGGEMGSQELRAPWCRARCKGNLYLYFYTADYHITHTLTLSCCLASG